MDSDEQTPEQRRLTLQICSALDLQMDLVVDLKLQPRAGQRPQVRALLRISDEQWERLLAVATEEWL